jgi:DNA repair exonuclease SbcCD ATPase subunit
MKSKNKINESMGIYEDSTGSASTRGGEIDAVIFGALALIGRTLKNAMTYGKLQSQKGPYLQQYELCGSSESKTVFVDTFKSAKLDEFKDKEIELKDAKEKVKEAAANQKEAIEGRSPADTKKREIIDHQADIKIAQLEKAEQQLKAAKGRLDNEVNNKWDSEKRKLEELKTKIDKTADGFLLGGTFKKRWENEFSEAKLDIDEKVTQTAREILTARDDKDALKELNAKEAKLKEKIAKKEEEAKELEANEEDDKAIDAIKLVPSLPKLENAREEFTGFLNGLKKDYEPEANKEKEETKEETKESASYIIEEDKSEDASPSEVIALMSKAYGNQTDENKPGFAEKIVKNIEAIKEFKGRIADLMVSCADECSKNADDLPSDIKGPFLKEGNPKPEIQKNVEEVKELYKEDLEKWKEAAKGGKKDNDGETSDTDNNEPNQDEEKIAALDSKIEGLKKDKQAKEDQLNSYVHPDVLAVEVAIKTAELQKAELGDDKDAIKSAEAALNTAQEDKKEAVKKEAENESPDVKEKKQKVEDIKAKIEEIKTAIADVKDKDKKGILQAALPAEEKKLKKAEEELEAAKNKGKESSEKTESVETEIPSKFMKFEEYIANKQKNK